MSSSVEQIKERLNITDVVGSYITLEGAGTNFKACCPFHHEKTPSFFVSPSRQTYHCFGCDVGGDIFSFVQEIEGVDFYGSLKILGEKSGVDISHSNTDSKTRSEKETLREVLEVAAKFFEQHLVTQQHVIDYLKERGVLGTTAKEFAIGYAPTQWRDMLNHLKKKGFSEEVMLKAGLVIKSEKGYYDRFRSRIMFPLTDSAGRIVGFSGRIFPNPEDGKSVGKYVNSPESDLYHKAKLLYGFDKAKLAIRKADYAVLVEGQMDLIMSHQAGVTHTIATSGTALTEDHLTLISRLTDNLVLAFDGDQAGIDAARRGIDHALSLGVDVRIVKLPSGKDPADIIREDPKLWVNLIEGSEHIIDFYLNVLVESEPHKRKLGKKVEDVVLPLLLHVARKIDQAHFVSTIAQTLSVSENTIWDILRELAHKTETPRHSSSSDSGTRLLTNEKTRRKVVERKIAGIIFWHESMTSTMDVDAIKERYKKIVGDEDYKRVFDLKDEIKKELIFESEIYYEGVEDIQAEITGLLDNLHKEVLKQTFENLMNEMHQAEQNGNMELVADLLKKCQDVSKVMNGLP